MAERPNKGLMSAGVRLGRKLLQTADANEDATEGEAFLFFNDVTAKFVDGGDTEDELDTTELQRSDEADDDEDNEDDSSDGESSQPAL